MDKNWIDLLSLFEQYGVKYLIVGGYAVMLHTQPRGTKDLDIFIDPSRKNAELVFAALVAFGAPMAGMTVEDFEDVVAVYQIGQPPLRIDLMCGLEGIAFDRAWVGRVDAVEDGVPVHYIGADDLIVNKLAVARLQDLADAESIRAARLATTSNQEGDEK